MKKMRKRNAKKDFWGCAEQPLWQKIIINTVRLILKKIEIITYPDKIYGTK